jgi:hypothetical protein
VDGESDVGSASSRKVEEWVFLRLEDGMGDVGGNEVEDLEVKTK